jgi:hypothetical protein
MMTSVVLKHPYFMKYDVKAGDHIRSFVNLLAITTPDNWSRLIKSPSSGKSLPLPVQEVFALGLIGDQPSRRAKKPLVPGRKAGKRGRKAGFKKILAVTADDCSARIDGWPGAMLLVVVVFVVVVLIR